MEAKKHQRTASANISKADILSNALGDIMSEKRSQVSKRGSSSVSRSYSNMPSRTLIKTAALAKTYRDVDSQADRYRDNIKETGDLQWQTAAFSHNKTGTKMGETYPAPYREGVFDRNKKYDGVKYVSNKTRARRFELDNISEAYNPNRMTAVTAADAIIDPNLTIRHEHALPLDKKEQRYTRLKQQGVFDHDRKNRVIHDYTGTPIIKVDQIGGIFDN